LTAGRAVLLVAVVAGLWWVWRRYISNLIGSGSTSSGTMDADQCKAAYYLYSLAGWSDERIYTQLVDWGCE